MEQQCLINGGLNRDRNISCFYKLEENKYHFFVIDRGMKEISYGWRMIGSKPEEGGMDKLTAVDPPGGPYTAVGTMIPDTDQEIVKIEHEKERGFILYTKTK